MTTGVFLLSPGGMFADANARAVHSNATITSSGTMVLTGFGNQELHLLINITNAPTGVAPTLQFTIQEIDPGNQGTPFAAPVVGSVLSGVGTDVLTLPTSFTSAVQVSWTITGVGASFTGVFATLVSKFTSPKVEGLGTAGAPSGGVISIQGVPGGEPLPISGTVMATNPSVGLDGDPVPAYSTQVGGSDGTNLQAVRVHDLDTGAGQEFGLGVSIRLPASGGSVAGGTSTDPIRVDPTGTTTQPISAASLPLPAGAATEATLATRVADATITARLNTLGQKAMAASAPVVIASDQSAVPIAGSDGVTNHEVRVHDLDTGAGTEYDLGVSIRLPGAGGSVAGGTAANPLRTDPTGTTTQPISAASLPLPTGAATEATLATRVADATITARLNTLGQKASAASAPVVIASDQSRLPVSTEVQLDYNTGAGTQSLSMVGLALPSGAGAVAGGTSTNPVRVDPTGTTTQPISAVSLPLPTGAATEATLATRVADATITARLNTLGQKLMAASAPVVIASDQTVPVSTTQLPGSLVGGRLDINVGAWLGSTGPTTGQKLMTNSLPVVIASDQTAISILSVGTNNSLAPTSSIQIGGTDGTNLQASRTHDLHTGASTEYNLGVSIRLPGASGSVAGGTSTNPLRVDPTGTTTQPISAVSLPLPTGAATDAVITARLGTLGQKTMAGSTPVVIASDQTPIPISGSISATNPSVGPTGDPVPTDATQIGGTDGTDLQVPHVFDADTGAGTQYVLGVQLRRAASGGSVEIGTSTNPVRVDPTGTTTQPISAVSLPLPTGAATDRTTAAGPFSVRLSDGAAFYEAPNEGQLPAALVGGRLDTNLGSWLGSTAPSIGQKAMASSLPVVIASNQTAVPVSGTVTANIGTTGGLALDATLTGGTAKAIVRGGAKGATAAADVTSTAEGLDHQALDVQIYHGGAAINPTQIRALTAADVVSVEVNDWIGSTAPTVGQKAMASSLPVVIASNQTAVPVSDNGGSLTVDTTQLPAALVGGRLDVNTGAWLGSTAPTVGQKTSANSLPVVIASDQSAVTVSGTVTANIGTTGGLALDATLTGGTQKAIVRGGAKGATVAADVTSTAEGADHQSLDVQIYHGGSAINPTQIRALTASDVVSVEVNDWLGSTAPTVGQKTSANSLPVVIASDQSAIPVTGSISATNPSVGTVGSAVPADATTIGASDGTNLRVPRVFDADSGAGTQYVLGAILRKSASGGSVEAGTSTDPLRVDPTGTTTQPVSDAGGSLTVDTTQLPAALVGGRLDTNNGAWLGSTAPTVGQKTSANSLPVVIASDQSAVTVADGGGSLTVDTTQLPAALVGGRLDTNNGAWLGSTAPTVGQKTSANSLPVVIASDQSAVTVSGTVTANIGTTGGLALDATLTGGTQKAINRGGAKGATVAADITSTAEGADHQALDVQIYHGGTAINPTQIRALTAADVVSVEINDWLGSTAPTVGQKTSANSLPVVIASDQSAVTVADGGGSLTVDTTQLPAALVGGRLDTNNGAWLGSTAPTVGQKTSANSIPVVIASDQSAITVTATNPSVGTNNAAAPGSSTQIGGSDGTNLQAARVFDADTGGGTQFVLGTILRKSASGGSVEAGTSTDPLRIDPTGTTTQPVSDAGGSLTVDTTQLPAALVGGRLDTNVGSWLGSTSPTVGQKTSANSLPVVIASDQSAIPITGSITATNPSVGPTEDPVPTDATQIGGSDGTDLHAVRVFDADTGAGTEYILGVGLRKFANGGSVEAGTSSDPLRIDPTGTTTQPVSDAGGSLTVDTTQLPVALVGGRLDTNVGAWLGSTAPTVGQKTSANSVPVVIASDQSAIPISGSITATNPSVGPTGDPVPTDATQIGGSDGTDLQSVRVFDLDTGGGTEYNLGVSIRLPASGGSVVGGTGTDPIRIDPTGTTAQPVTDNGGSLTVDTTQLPAALVGGRLDTNVGAWLGSTAPTVGQKTSANSLPVVIASDQSAVAVSGTVTANIGTTGGLALDATLTGGTQKAIVRGGAKGATVAADVTSTAEGVDHQALDVQIYHGGTAINPTQIRALTNADVVSAEVTTWLGSTAPTVGQKTSANSLPVVIASDQSAIAVTPPANQSVNLAQVGGVTTVTGGVAGSQGVGGLAASGAAVAGNPVLTGGSDGTNARTIATDADGIQYASDLAQAIARARVSGFAQALFGEVTTAAVAKAAINATAFVEQTAGAQRSISSTSANDAAAGTGARTVRVTYFTLSGLVVAGPLTETITLNGTTPVNTVATNICFVEKIEVLTVGSTGSNVGTLNFFAATAGGGGTIVSVAATDNITKLAHHYVPTGRTCMIYDITANNNAVSGQTPRISLESFDLGTANAAERQVFAIRFDGRASLAINPSVPTVVVGPARINAYVTPTNNASQVTTTNVRYVEI